VSPLAAFLTLETSLLGLESREGVAFFLAHVTGVLCHVATLRGGGKMEEERDREKIVVCLAGESP
jgi:hypothetical protein